MAVSLQCPSCSASLKLANPVAPGKAVRCPKCQKAFKPTADEPVPQPTKSRPAAARAAVKPAAPARKSDRHDDDEDDRNERPVRTSRGKKSPKQKGNSTLFWSLVIAGGLLLLGGGTVGLLWGMGYIGGTQPIASRPGTEPTKPKDDNPTIDAPVWTARKTTAVGERIWDMSASQDGKLVGLELSSRKPKKQVLDIESERALFPEAGWNSAHGNIAVSPDGKWIAIANAGAVTVYSLETGATAHTLGLEQTGDFSGGSVLLFSGNSELIVANCGKRVKGWEVGSGKPKFNSLTDCHEVKTVDLLPNGKQAVIGGDKAQLELWDLEQGKKIKAYTGHQKKSEFTFVTVSPDGRRMASKMLTDEIIVWDVESGSVQRRIQNCPDFQGFKGFAFLADNKTLAYSNQKCEILLVDVETGKTRAILRGHAESNKDSSKAMIVGIACTANGKTLLSASSDQTIRIWDIKE